MSFCRLDPPIVDFLAARGSSRSISSAGSGVLVVVIGMKTFGERWLGAVCGDREATSGRSDAGMVIGSSWETSCCGGSTTTSEPSCRERKASRSCNSGLS